MLRETRFEKRLDHHGKHLRERRRRFRFVGKLRIDAVDKNFAFIEKNARPDFFDRQRVRVSGGANLFAVFAAQALVGQQNIKSQNRFFFIFSERGGFPEYSRNFSVGFYFGNIFLRVDDPQIPIQNFRIDRRRRLVDFIFPIPCDAPATQTAPPVYLAIHPVRTVAFRRERPIGKPFTRHSPQNQFRNVGRNGFNFFRQSVIEIILIAEFQKIMILASRFRLARDAFGYCLSECVEQIFDIRDRL